MPVPSQFVLLTACTGGPGAIGQRIGAVVLDRTLCHGGMGSVFLAHRADGSVEQKVAVKLIRPEQLDAHTLTRFRLERQVLALLQHPNISTLLRGLGDFSDSLRTVWDVQWCPGEDSNLHGFTR
jgi:hypothetical protein